MTDVVMLVDVGYIGVCVRCDFAVFCKSLLYRRGGLNHLQVPMEVYKWVGCDACD